MGPPSPNPQPSNEEQRVQALRELGILDTEPEERFDRLTSSLAEALDVPLAYVSLIDSDRQWLKSRFGDIDDEIAREEALCSNTIQSDQTLVVEDAREDVRFADKRLVTETPGVRFYAGVPISANGQRVGTVCVADQKARSLDPQELAILRGYARQVAEELNAKRTLVAAYCPEDADWLMPLLTGCKALCQTGQVDLWSASWYENCENRLWRLETALWRAKAATLFVSKRFLSSVFVESRLLQDQLARREREGLMVLPILVEPCAWQEVDWLARRTVWPAPDRALRDSDEAQIEEGFAELAERLSAIVREPPPSRVPEVRTQGDEEPAPTAPPAPAEDKPPLLFLSHAGEDGEAARQLARRLEKAGVDVWLDLDQLRPGDTWQEALEEGLQRADAFAVYIGRRGIEQWIGREVRVALDRSVKDPSFRVIPILGPGAEPDALPPFLAQQHWLDLREADAEDLSEIKKLLSGILQKPAEAVSLIPAGEAPFRGLLAFDVDHAQLFFGRDSETGELVERLRTAPFLAVVGDSGSGKSSLVRAGLVPALHRGRFHDGDTWAESWRIAILRPGQDPFRELANALPSLVPEMEAAERIETRKTCADQLTEGSDGLLHCVAGLVPSGHRTLLVVDQFEELFTQTESVEERHRFIDSLLATADTAGDHPTHVVITLRADFYSHCFEHPLLPRVVSENQYALRRVGRDQLAEIIEKPLAMAGARMEPGLAETILHDVGLESANLSLLEHTLLELWERRSRGTLTHESYVGIGRVQGALEHHADDVFGRLDAEEQQVARKLLLSLVAPGKREQIARRRAKKSELLPAGRAQEKAEKVLMHLIEQRLLTVQRSSDEGGEEIELAHEALIRGWGELRRWLAEDHEFLLWRERTRAAFGAWEQSGQDHGALLRGAPLAEAKRWLEDRGEDLSEAGTAFIRASLQRRRRARRIERAIAAAITVLALGASVAAWIATGQRKQAQENLRQAKRAVDTMLTEVGKEHLADFPQLVHLRRELLGRAESFYTTFQKQNPELRLDAAVAQRNVGTIHALAHDLDGAERAYKVAVQQLESSADEPQYRVELASTLFALGELVRTEPGEQERARDYLEQAIGHQEELVEDSEDPLRRFELARSHNSLGIVLKNLGWQAMSAREEVGDDEIALGLFREAEASYLAAQSLFESLSAGAERGASKEGFRQGLAWTHTNLGELLNKWPDGARGRQDREAVERHYGKAILVLQELTDESQRFEYKLELANSYNNLSNFLLGEGRYEDAQRANGAGRELFLELADAIPKIRDELGNSQISAGVIFEERGNPDEAEAVYDRAIEIYRRLGRELGEDFMGQPGYRYALALANQVDLLTERGNAAKAVHYAQELCRALPDLSDRAQEVFGYYCD